MGQPHTPKKARERRSPGNTSRDVNDDPVGFLAESILFGASGAILHQEAVGQDAFVNSDTLPTELGGDNAKSILEAAGVKFLGPVDGDPLFQYVQLPKGWRKVPTDHSMWSKLLDDKRRTRALVFYKAAFYDRSAALHLERRFSVRSDYERRTAKNEAVCDVVDADGDRVVFTTTAFHLPLDTIGQSSWYWRQVTASEKEAESWLGEHFPNWLDPAAYRD